MDDLYPLKFSPIPREMIWGGNSLKELFNKPFPAESRIGESWEISAVDNNVSVVSNGYLKGNDLRELVEVYMGDLVGEKVFNRFGTEFPLLIKLIDARDVLSVQVHPDDDLAATRHNGKGKTEMWYILHAQEDSELISGFNRKVSRGLFLDNLNNGSLLDILNFEKVTAGDVFFIPAGRIHAIGKGIILAEIQQTSDITYRVYDWDRVGNNGKPREMHLDLALDAIDYNYYNSYKTAAEVKKNSPVLLADCEYFTARLIDLESSLTRDYSLLDSFVIYLCAGGEVDISGNWESVRVNKGETVLIPASAKEVHLDCKKSSVLLEVFISQAL